MNITKTNTNDTKMRKIPHFRELGVVIGDMVNIVFSNNETVSIWADCDNNGKPKKLWTGAGWEIPKEYRTKKGVIFGVCTVNIMKTRTVNIRLKNEEVKNEKV